MPASLPRLTWPSCPPGAWRLAIRSHLSGTDRTATLYPPGIDPIGRSPNVRFEMADGGAIGLAGFLVEMPAVSLTAVGDSAPTLLRSLAEIERHPMEWAEAGAYRSRSSSRGAAGANLSRSRTRVRLRAVKCRA